MISLLFSKQALSVCSTVPTLHVSSGVTCPGFRMGPGLNAKAQHQRPSSSTGVCVRAVPSDSAALGTVGSCVLGMLQARTRVGRHFLLQGNLPDPGFEPTSESPALPGGFFTAEPRGSPAGTKCGADASSLCVGWQLRKASSLGLGNQKVWRWAQ